MDASRESQRSESDLGAQWKAADWVFWASVVAAAQLLASIVGLFYIKRTLDATLAAVEDTGIATEAMVVANQIARDVQRPWLVTKQLIVGKRHDPRHAGSFFGTRVAIEVVNCGSSPAIDCAIEWKWTFGVLDDADVVEFFNSPCGNGSFVLGQGLTHWSEALLFDAAQTEAIFSGGQTLFVFARYLYRDALTNAQRHTHVALKARPMVPLDVLKAGGAEAPLAFDVFGSHNVAT